MLPAAAASHHSLPNSVHPPAWCTLRRASGQLRAALGASVPQAAQAAAAAAVAAVAAAAAAAALVTCAAAARTQLCEWAATLLQAPEPEGIPSLQHHLLQLILLLHRGVIEEREQYRAELGGHARLWVWEVGVGGTYAGALRIVRDARPVAPCSQHVEVYHTTSPPAPPAPTPAPAPAPGNGRGGAVCGAGAPSSAARQAMNALRPPGRPPNNPPVVAAVVLLGATHSCQQLPQQAYTKPTALPTTPHHTTPHHGHHAEDEPLRGAEPEGRPPLLRPPRGAPPSGAHVLQRLQGHLQDAQRRASGGGVGEWPTRRASRARPRNHNTSPHAPRAPPHTHTLTPLPPSLRSPTPTSWTPQR